MSRTTIEVPSNNHQQNSQIIDQILTSHNYKKTIKNGEEYYKCGVGAIVAPKFIKYYFQDDKLVIQGWVKNFAAGPETDLGGVVGAIPKKSCQKVIDEILNSINQQYTPQQQPIYQQQRQQKNIKQQQIPEKNNSINDMNSDEYTKKVFKKLNEK